MADHNTSIEDLKALQRQFVEARDWGQFHSPKNLAMALSVEAGELLECFLWVSEADKPGARKANMADVEAELADVFICAFNLANTLGLDISKVVKRKVETNAKKYPADLVRGRAEKYDEIRRDTKDP